MLNTIKLAISSKINDRDDFKRLILRSSQKEIYIYGNGDGEFIYQSDGKESVLSESDLFNNLERLIQLGFRDIICESYSGSVNIIIPSDTRSQMKLKYHQHSAELEGENLIDPGNRLLRVLEIANSDGSISSDLKRKYVQIDNFIKLVYLLLDKSSQKGKVNILDCAAGKSYLSYVMNYFLREKMHRSCHFYCIDTNSDLIEKCIQMQNQLDYQNMDFHVSKIRDFNPKEKIDIVCSLHACDTASDEAIAKGIELDAPFLLIVPCCQHEVIDQLSDHPLKAIARHGVYKARLADLLTDAMRTLILEAAGYKVTVTEYVSPIYTPKNIMIQAEKVQSSNKMALEQYMELKSMFGDLNLELEKMLPWIFGT